MRIKRLSSALVLSAACHFIVAVIVGLHWVTETQPFKDLIGAEVLQPKEPPKPQARKLVVKPVIKPIASIALNPPNGAAFQDVFFKNSGTNPFIDTEDDAFSTFGMDVDTASYAVMRRYPPRWLPATTRSDTR